MPLGERNQPYMTYRFAIEIDGIEEGYAEATGLQAEVQTEDVREGGVNEFFHKVIKGGAYQNIVLKRGLTNSNTLWNWHYMVITGQIKRKDVSIILYDHQGNEQWRWNFVDAFPVKWTGPDFKADGNSIAFESLEFAHHGFTKE